MGINVYLIEIGQRRLHRTVFVHGPGVEAQLNLIAFRHAPHPRCRNIQVPLHRRRGIFTDHHHHLAILRNGPARREVNRHHVTIGRGQHRHGGTSPAGQVAIDFADAVFHIQLLFAQRVNLRLGAVGQAGFACLKLKNSALLQRQVELRIEHIIVAFIEIHSGDIALPGDGFPRLVGVGAVF